MKTTCLMAFALLAVAIGANAQLMRAEELERYAEQHFGSKWTDVAKNLKSDAMLTLDHNNALTFIQVVEAPERTAGQLYATLNYWFTATFNDANSTIKLNDRELGCIIAQGSVENVAAHTGGSNKYSVNIRPIIRVDIKDGRCRITYSLQAYYVEKVIGAGAVAKAKKVARFVAFPYAGLGKKKYADEVWPLDQTFPFARKDAFSAKKTSSKAFVMSYAYSQVMMDKIEEAIKNGMTGEDESW